MKKVSKNCGKKNESKKRSKTVKVGRTTVGGRDQVMPKKKCLYE